MADPQDDGTTIAELNERLDRIVAEVRSKDTTLERGLDLLEEAIGLGTRAVDLVDTAAPSADEREEASRADGADAPRPRAGSEEEEE
ncbi:MAG: exodeoxyribonuclease VII small subunit [Coriobacteriales bacterium]|jgi:exodeoxyribonuclease VII small subunit